MFSSSFNSSVTCCDCWDNLSYIFYPKSKEKFICRPIINFYGPLLIKKKNNYVLHIFFHIFFSFHFHFPSCSFFVCSCPLLPVASPSSPRDHPPCLFLLTLPTSIPWMSWFGSRPKFYSFRLRLNQVSIELELNCNIYKFFEGFCCWFFSIIFANFKTYPFKFGWKN